MCKILLFSSLGIARMKVFFLFLFGFQFKRSHILRLHDSHYLNFSYVLRFLHKQMKTYLSFKHLQHFCNMPVSAFLLLCLTFLLYSDYFAPSRSNLLTCLSA